MLFLSPLASASFIILYIVSSLLAYTLEQKVSQEMTLFYTTFALGLSTMAAVVIMQMLGFLRPLSDLYSSFRNWYETQLETVSSLTTDAMDADMIPVVGFIFPKHAGLCHDWQFLFGAVHRTHG